MNTIFPTAPASLERDSDRPRNDQKRPWIESAARLLFGKLLPRLPYPVVRGPLRGYRYLLGATAGAAGGVSVHLGMQEAEQALCLSRTLRKGGVFFDVGANVGFYSLLGSKIVGPNGTVVAFEPFPRNLAFLWCHLDLNRARNVRVVPMACAEREATELFVAGENHALGRLAGNVTTTSERAQATLISTITLDSVVERLQLQPDVIKIDVEGAELRVLEGAQTLLSQARPVILLSVHSDTLRDSCLLFLSGKDYAVTPLNAAEFLAEPRTRL